MTSFSLSPPFSTQTAVTTQIVNWAQSLDEGTTSDTAAPPRHEYCIFLFILSEGHKSLWLRIMPRRIIPRNFVSSATSYINLFLSAKFPNLINHENMEVSNFFIIWQNPFFIKLSEIKLLKYFCWRVSPWCIITSLNVWVNSRPAGVDVTYCPDPGAHETLLAWFLHGGEWRVGRKKIVIKWWIFIKTFSVSAITIILHLYFWIFNSLGSHHPQSLPQLVKGVWFLCDTSLPVREFMLEGRDRAMYCVTSGNRW